MFLALKQEPVTRFVSLRSAWAEAQPYRSLPRLRRFSLVGHCSAAAAGDLFGVFGQDAGFNFRRGLLPDFSSLL